MTCCHIVKAGDASYKSSHPSLTTQVSRASKENATLRSLDTFEGERERENQVLNFCLIYPKKKKVLIMREGRASELKTWGWGSQTENLL